MLLTYVCFQDKAHVVLRFILLTGYREAEDLRVAYAYTYSHSDSVKWNIGSDKKIPKNNTNTPMTNLMICFYYLTYLLMK